MRMLCNNESDDNLYMSPCIVTVVNIWRLPCTVCRSDRRASHTVRLSSYSKSHSQYCRRAEMKIRVQFTQGTVIKVQNGFGGRGSALWDFTNFLE